MRGVWICLMCAACARSAPVGSAPEAAGAAVAADALEAPATEVVWADTPFTAEEIRDSLAVGTHMIMEQSSGDDEPMVLDWHVVAADGDGVTIEYTVRRPTGEVLDGPSQQTDSWIELRDHARFEHGVTTMSAETIETALGSLESRKYAVQKDDGLHTYWFADAIPGPPVLYTVTGLDGSAARMEMTEREPARP